MQSITRKLILVSLVGAPLLPASAAEGPARDEVNARRGAPAKHNDTHARHRQLFLEVERIARLAEAEQAKELPRLYRDLAPLSPMSEMVLSSHPAKLLQRAGFDRGEPFVGYADELAAAARLMTPEQTADQIALANGPMFFPVAARRRSMQVLLRHPEQLKRLVGEDLKSDDPNAVGRGMTAISSLKLTDFLDQVTATYLAGGPHAEAARGCLTWLNDPRATKPILADIAKNPATLKRHHLLLSGLLRGEPADPMLLKLLGSDDADTRYHAVFALSECRDAALAPHVSRLAADPDARIRATATRMAFGLPEADFAKVREAMVKNLADAELDVRLEAACGLGRRKDLAAARPLLGLLATPEMPQQFHLIVQAVSALAGTTFGYEPHTWGPTHEPNRRAMARFDQWIKSRE